MQKIFFQVILCAAAVFAQPGTSTPVFKNDRAGSGSSRDLLGRKEKSPSFTAKAGKAKPPQVGACQESAVVLSDACAGQSFGDRPLFKDDFREGGLAAWTPAEGFWNLSASPLSNTRALRSDSGGMSTVFAGRDDWGNYTVEGTVTFEKGWGEAGLLGRVQGGHHYYELALGTDDQGRKGWLIRLRHHEHIMTLASGRFEYAAGKSYSLRFDLRGQRLRGWIAEPGASEYRLLGEAKDAAWSQGAIGLHSEGASARFTALSVTGTAAAAATGPWGPKITLRDISGTFPGMPDGGWWVTPIHANLMPATGKVLITGWGRRDPVSCDKAGGGARKNGTTFILDPASLTPDTARTIYIQPINEQNQQASEVLYCAGHNTLADGRIFFSGGSHYTNLGGIGGGEVEDGVNYARIFDPAAGSFARITQPMEGGPVGLRGVKWYPTHLLLPDGTTLITGGFKQCCETPNDWNLSAEIFDPGKLMAGSDPWNVIVQHEEGNPDMAPTRGYTNLFLLPQPVSAAMAGGIDRPIAIFAGAGKVLLFNQGPGLMAAQRFFARPNAVVPSPATVEKGEGASGAMLSDGRLTFLGGSADGTTAEKFHIYDPSADTWTQFSLGISRHFGNNVLLPDGTILAINGYKLNATFIGDVRQPQIIDPITRTFTTLPAWDNDVLERGYHSFSVLLKDGRILIGGGTAADYAVACERADARIFSPPYLTAGARPIPANISDGQILNVGGRPITVKYSGGAVRSARGAVLMAPTSDTHAFDMGQRYVPLLQGSPSAGTLTLTPPPNSSVAPPGEYLLFLISGASTPSVGVHVHLRQLPSPWIGGDIGITGFPGSAVEASGKFTVRGSGSDIWGTADQFQFVSRPINGDGSLTARITGPSNTNAWAKAGVMIRESAAPGSRHAMMILSAASGLAFQRRLQTAGVSVNTGAALNSRTWVRLARAGNLFTAYASTNGVAWDVIGSANIAMPAGALMGLVVTSHNNGAVSQADFQNVTALE